MGGHSSSTKSCSGDCSGTIVRVTPWSIAFDQTAHDSAKLEENECKLHFEFMFAVW